MDKKLLWNGHPEAKVGKATSWRTQVRLARTFPKRKMNFGAILWRLLRDTIVRKYDFERTYQFVLSTKRELSGENIS